MSHEDRARVVCSTLQAAVKEPEVARQLSMLQEAKRVLEAIYSEVWHQHIKGQAIKKERDWL